MTPLSGTARDEMPARKAQVPLRETWRFRGGDAAEAVAHGGAGAGVSHAVVEKLVGPVGSDGHGLNLVRQESRAGFGADVAGLLRLPNGAVEDGDPFTHNCGDAVTDGTTTAVEFKRGRGKEATSGKELLFDVRQPAVEQIPQAKQSFGRGKRGAGDLIDKNLASSFDGGQLQLFFRAKMSEEATLAHTQIFGKAADGEALEPFERGDVDGAAEDDFAGAETASLGARSPGLAGGTGNGWHEKIVTRGNK